MVKRKQKPIEDIHKDLLSVMERIKEYYIEESDYKIIMMQLDSAQKSLHEILIKKVSGENGLGPVYDEKE